MKTILRIDDIEMKTSKAGKKYHSIKTNQGTMSCFESDIVDKCKKRLGKFAEVETATKGDFTNIREYHRDIDETPESEERDIEVPVEKIGKSIDLKEAGIAMRYAVDLVCAGKAELKEMHNLAGEILEKIKELAE